MHSRDDLSLLHDVRASAKRLKSWGSRMIRMFDWGWKIDPNIGNLVLVNWILYT